MNHLSACVRASLRSGFPGSLPPCLPPPLPPSLSSFLSSLFFDFPFPLTVCLTSSDKERVREKMLTHLLADVFWCRNMTPNSSKWPSPACVPLLERCPPTSWTPASERRWRNRLQWTQKETLTPYPSTLPSEWEDNVQHSNGHKPSCKCSADG